jgi:hypothetical protein
MESLKAHLKLTNDSYHILLRFKNSSESYYRDRAGWVKVSTRGRKFRATAEQVLNHLLPALANVKPNVSVEVMHRPSQTTVGEDFSSL